MDGFQLLPSLMPKAPDWTIPWKTIEEVFFAFVVPMSRTEQNPVFHGEGDVWTHTKMVCEELSRQASFRTLTEERRQAVFLAALLHDIGKISTTRWENGKWTSPNHSSVGARMARQLLWQEFDLCGTPRKLQFRETVCNLIRYHSVPPHAIDDPEGKRKLVSIGANGQLCPMLDVELLCILSEADARGRVCGDMKHMLEQIQLCAELAKEARCFTGPFDFPSAHTQFAYLSGRNIQPGQELYDDTWGEVILLSGLPGTGKDTWIRKHDSQLPMISLDAIREETGISPGDHQSKVLETARERARALLREKQSFVWNATNLSPMVRKKQIDLFAAYHASVRIVYLETGVQEQCRRNESRPDAVPGQALFRMMENLAPPEASEAHLVEWHCV